MGRPRKYNSEAERVAAHRARKKIEELGKNVIEDKTYNPRKMQNQWNSRQDPPWITLHDEPSLHGDKHFFLCAEDSRSPDEQKKDSKLTAKEKQSYRHLRKVLKKKRFFVVERNRYVPEGARTPFRSIRDAKSTFRTLVSGKIPESWYGIEKYYAQAEELLLSYEKYETLPVEKRDSHQFPKFEYRLAFFLALLEKHREGFHDYHPRSTAEDVGKEEARERRRLVLRTLGNREIPKDFQGAQATFDIMARELVLANKGNSAIYTWRQIIVLNNIMKMFDEMALAFKEYRGMKQSLKASAIKLVEESTTLGLLDGSDSFEWIPLDEPDRALEQLLAHAYKTDIDLYFYIQLALTSGLRIIELDRLCEKKLFYLRSDGTLNYNTLGITNKKDFLVQKTMKKTKLKDLPNPFLSIIGRIALKYFNPELNPKNYFTNPKGMRANPALAPYHSRCLRTTTAMMIMYCSSVEGEGRSDRSEAQMRLGHSTRHELDSRYAKRRVSAAPPEVYFNCPRVINRRLGGRGQAVSLTKGSILWDIFLLNDFIKRFTNDPKVGPRKAAEYWNMIETEALEFQRLIGVNKKEELTEATY